MNSIIKIFYITISLLILSCTDTPNPEPESEPQPEVFPGALKINEVVAKNSGVAVDENGQTSDWIELVNSSQIPINLDQYFISDDDENYHRLPNLELAPKQVFLLWADDSEIYGHLPFKISSAGENLSVFNSDKQLIDFIIVPALLENQSFSRFPSATGEFESCRYTSPNKINTDSCTPIVQEHIKDDVVFASFNQADWPVIAPLGLAINELALFPADFIELKNFSNTNIFLGDYQLELSVESADLVLDYIQPKAIIELNEVWLKTGELIAINISPLLVNAIALNEFREGEVKLVKRNIDPDSAPDIQDETIDSVMFMSWPDNTFLTRQLNAEEAFMFCTNSSKNLSNQCDILESRELGNRTHGLYTPNDFSQLALGGSKQDISSVKFVIDIKRNNTRHFLSADVWPLHYSFVREVIETKVHLNRCDINEVYDFNFAWYEFSQDNYSDPINRRYHLGTLSHHGNAQIKAVEFTFGDEITAAQMKSTFYHLTGIFYDAYDWVLRVQDDSQIITARLIENQLPIISPNAPFKNIKMQTLSFGISFGYLKYIDTNSLHLHQLNQQDILITNDVPNNIDFVGGLITQSFQTPLAHVNLLSQARGTPNLALPNAANLEQFSSLLGQLVRFEVNINGYDIRVATLQQAQDFWDSQNIDKPILIPRLDLNITTLVDLTQASFDDLPSIGAKAAQLAQLYQVNPNESACPEITNFNLPYNAFAIPMSFYYDHFINSGAALLYSQLLLDEEFETDLSYKKQRLLDLQQLIFDFPIDESLLANVNQWVQSRYGKNRVRFRSSSNTEDLSEFNGAGLYDSISAELDSNKRPIELAIKTVWSS
ncbi:MAG: lamin tail domain-containing protein [Saccharospirillaceae bacterium]|nr:lamin tail domain-containing protein [Saccharospirillaceae bacterium]